MITEKLKYHLLPLRLLRDIHKNQKRYDINHLQKFEAILRRNGYSFSQFDSILDFGCGFGRLTQHLFTVAPQARIFGCETESDLVQECRKRFSNGTFVQNDPTPPLDFAEEEFDFIYSYSVFTHLSESNHIAWLKELARKLRPGGVMIHTIHSYETLDRLQFFSPESLAKYEFHDSVPAFTQVLERYHYAIGNMSRPEYGYTIISKDYVVKRWPEYSGLRLVDYADAAIESYPEGCHDVVILAKRGDLE